MSEGEARRLAAIRNKIEYGVPHADIADLAFLWNRLFPDDQVVRRGVRRTCRRCNGDCREVNWLAGMGVVSECAECKGFGSVWVEESELYTS